MKVYLQRESKRIHRFWKSFSIRSHWGSFQFIWKREKTNWYRIPNLWPWLSSLPKSSNFRRFIPFMKMKILTLMKPMQSFKDQKSQTMDSSFPNLTKAHQFNKSFACLRSLLTKNHKTGTSTILLIFWTKI